MVLQGRAPGRVRGAITAEILIVSGIIAILVLACGIQFERSQQRSKMSRVRAEMKQMRTALSAYRADMGSYPRHSWGCPPFSDTYNGGAVWNTLTAAVTTPVAYLTDLARDPFAPPESVSYRSPLYGFSNTEFEWHTTVIGSSCFRPGMPSFVYVPPDLASIESSHYYFGDYYLLSAGPDESYSGSTFMTYDASNGTVSAGNIFVSDKFAVPTHVPHNAFGF